MGAVALSALIASAGLPSTTAGADDKALLGGGAGIVVNDTPCTLTTIGHDKSGDLVGFTAASCGGPGSPVSAVGGANVGSVVAVEDSLKYAVIKFDPAQVTPTANFAGFAINGIGPDPGFRQPACTDGAATGIQCGGITTLPGTLPGRNMAEAVFQPGDAGRPVTTDDLLFGMAYRGWIATGGFRLIPESNLILFSAILDDVNAKGGPGAGFSPVPPA
ncbi:chymotrypsin family serine protease [Mycolicibacter icosiumassiliensis]|uniref:hypothetical protein n=1 Tax=Mycolicibacter icosiumassiliensis TaxID=1792835 RepID=UPI00082E30E4|nr:hypothetical protein [Mycolicibacter icosiumassiliensis]